MRRRGRRAFMPRDDQPCVLLPVAAATAAAAMIAVVAWVGHGVINEVYDNYTCEALDGYDPSGATTAERYPPGTWAGLCEKNESGAATLYGVLMGIGAVAILGACAATVRAVGAHAI